MARYEIRHRCGHTTEQQIYGTDVRGERERTAARLARGLCPSCTAEQRAAEHAVATAAATEAAAAESLPALSGSQKQVAWAETIRRTVLDAMTTEAAAVIAKDPTRIDVDLVTRYGHQAFARQTDAAWWIDNGRGNWMTAVRAALTPADHEAMAAERAQA